MSDPNPLAPASTPSAEQAGSVSEHPVAAYDLRDTTLVIANAAQERVWEDRAVAQWSMPRGWSYERSLEINRECCNLVGARQGRRIIWALVPRDDPHGTEVLSATRIFKRDAKVMRAGSAGVERVTSYVITGVITPAAYRKRGYARHMLRLLHYCISIPSTLPPFPVEAWGPPPLKGGPNDATFSTLWSAVGPDFYRKARIGDGEGSRDGWVLCYDQEVSLKVGGAHDEVQRAALDRILGAGWSLQTCVPKEAPAAASSYEAQLLQQAVSGSKAVAALDSLESPGQLPWNMRKYELATPASRRLAHNAWGITAPDGASWVYWACAIAGNKPTMLLVNHIHLADPGEMPAVLDVLVEHARNMQAVSISAFDLEPALVPAWTAREAELKDRDDHLGAIAWYGPEPATSVRAIMGQHYAVA